MRDIYTVQPYQVGSKYGKSLALIIPSKAAKRCNVSTSTVFALWIDENTKRITLRNLDVVGNSKDMIITRSMIAAIASQSSGASC